MKTGKSRRQDPEANSTMIKLGGSTETEKYYSEVKTAPSAAGLIDLEFTTLVKNSEKVRRQSDGLVYTKGTNYTINYAAGTVTNTNIPAGTTLEVLYFHEDFGGEQVGAALDNYYTKAETYSDAEIDALLATKSSTTHNHDTRYYTEAETDAMLDPLEAKLAGHIIQDGGTSMSQRSRLRFRDDHFNLTDSAVGDVTIVEAIQQSGGHIIENEGVPLTQRPNMDFRGPGVNAWDDNSSNQTVIDITGGGGDGGARYASKLKWGILH
jgi:hypothetical protein